MDKRKRRNAGKTSMKLNNLTNYREIPIGYKMNLKARTPEENRFFCLPFMHPQQAERFCFKIQSNWIFKWHAMPEELFFCWTQHTQHTRMLLILRSQSYAKVHRKIRRYHRQKRSVRVRGRKAMFIILRVYRLCVDIYVYMCAFAP